MKHLKLILSILFIFCLTRTYADDSNYLFRHYQVENGLSDNMATCCVQDRKGYIWIGTRDGLNRFDGYTFKVFRNDPDETETLGSKLDHMPGLRHERRLVGRDAFGIIPV